ncbi:MAG: hypothetical protein Q9218_004263 [Villophora microphyllina]
METPQQEWRSRREQNAKLVAEGRLNEVSTIGTTVYFLADVRRILKGQVEKEKSPFAQKLNEPIYKTILDNINSIDTEFMKHVPEGPYLLHWKLLALILTMYPSPTAGIGGLVVKLLSSIADPIAILEARAGEVPCRKPTVDAMAEMTRPPDSSLKSLAVPTSSDHPFLFSLRLSLVIIESTIATQADAMGYREASLPLPDEQRLDKESSIKFIADEESRLKLQARNDGRAVHCGDPSNRYLRKRFELLQDLLMSHVPGEPTLLHWKILGMIRMLVAPFPRHRRSSTTQKVGDTDLRGLIITLFGSLADSMTVLKLEALKDPGIERKISDLVPCVSALDEVLAREFLAQSHQEDDDHVKAFRKIHEKWTNRFATQSKHVSKL